MKNKNRETRISIKQSDVIYMLIGLLDYFGHYPLEFAFDKSRLVYKSNEACS